MEKVRIVLLRILGLFWTAFGLYILYAAVSSGDRSLLSYLAGVILAGSGAFFAWKAKSIVQTVPPATEFQKTISRRIILFTLMMLGYILLAVYIAVRADMRGVNLRRIMIVEAVGLAAVILAYLWLLRQIITQRKNYRIQDPLMARFPPYENNKDFHFLVSAVNSEEGKVSVKGRMLGTLDAGDPVWVLVYGSALRAEVKEVIMHDTESMLVFEEVPAERFEDAVITTRIPYPYRNSEQPFANAELSALLEFMRAKEAIPAEQMIRIAWLAARGTFLMRTIPEPADTWFRKLHRWLFGYSGFFRAGTVHPEHTSEDMYAVYTDRDAYNRIEEKEGGPKSEAMIMTFPQIMELRAKQPGAVVLNPFGPVSFLLSEALLDHIMEQNWYKNEIAGETDNKKSGQNS